VTILTETDFEQLIGRLAGIPSFTFGKELTEYKLEEEEVKQNQESEVPKEVRSEMWSDFYRPRTISDLVGN
jgi:hypothetical protein